MAVKSLMVIGGVALFGAAIVAVADTSAQLPTVNVTGNAIKDEASMNIVTVARSSLPVLDTPMAIHTVEPATIRDQQTDSLIEALRNVSGVQPMFYLGGAYERFVVRGFTQSLSTYRNGVQLPFSRFHAANTERVEVLKGPAALEYGMSDPGGVINIVTRKPTVDRQFHVEQSASSHDDYRTSLGASGALNDASTVLARVDASYLNGNGFRELSNNEETFASPSLSWLVSENTTINLATEFDHARRRYDAGVPAIGDEILDVPRDRTFTQDGPRDEYDNRLIDINIEHQFNNQWALSAGYSDYSTETYYRSIYAYNNNLQPGDETAGRSAWFGPEDFTTRTLWSHVSGKWRSGSVTHHLLAGVQSSTLDGKASASDTSLDTINLYTYRYQQSNIDIAAIEALPTDTWISEQDDKSAGIFVQDQMVIAEHIIAQLGLRYDRIDRELDTAYDSPVLHEERDDSKVSPRAALLYKLTPAVSAYIGYSESFGPGFNYEPSALYKPETAKQYEVGVKTHLADDRLTATVAVFELTKQNLPTPDPDNQHSMVAIGEANSHGIEFDLQSALSQHLSLLTNYTYLDTEITRDFDDGDGNNNKGNHLPNAPRHQGSVWLRYLFDRQLRGLSVGGGAFAAASRYGDTRNTYTDDGYVRWDAFAAYRFAVYDSAVTAQINVFNLTDETYYMMRDRWTNMAEEPRTVVGSLAVDF